VSTGPPVQLRRLFRVVNGGTPTADTENWEGDIPWATPVDLAPMNGGVVEHTARTLTEIGLRSGSALVPGGSLIVSTRAPVGYVAEVSQPTAFNQGCRGLVPMRPLDTRYFRYQLSALTDVLQSRGQGSTFGELSSDALASTELLAPSLNHQRTIADYLDAETARIDALIAAEQHRLAAAQERLMSAAQGQVLGRTDDTPQQNMPLGPLWPIPDDWFMRRNKTFLREVIDLSNAGGEELLTVSHITGVTPRSEKDVTMFLAESNIGYKRVCPGDLVVNTMWAWMGALGVSPYEGIVSPAYGVYHFTERDVCPAYFDALFRTPAYITEMTRYSKGVWTSRLRLYPESFLGLHSPYPPPGEQRKIADGIDEVKLQSQRLSSLLRSSIDLLHERRQALITAAVTGELDIAA